MKTILGLITLVFTINLFSAELDGIKFDDKIKLENKELVLNGIGIRKATIFKVKVYYGGLYLEQKATDHNAFLNTTAPKQIVMNFVHDVDAKKLHSGFMEGFENANKNAASLKPLMEKFNSCIGDVQKGDKVIISFLNDGVLVSFKGKACDKISSVDFSRALLSIWFVNPADENLTKGLLAK